MARAEGGSFWMREGARPPFSNLECLVPNRPNQALGTLVVFTSRVESSAKRKV